MARRRLLRHEVNFRAPELMRMTLADEIAAARHAFAEGVDGWRNLERAHIMSQPWAVDHVAVHVAMLRRAWRERDRVEMQGQLLRIVVAGPGSLIDRYPIGNNGRARVSATLPMVIADDDVRAALAGAGQQVSD